MAPSPTATAATSSRLFLPASWLLSPRGDTLCLFGSVLISFGLFALWQAGRLSPIALVAIWIFAFHGPHFWGTMSRTYLDRSEWTHRRRLFLGSALWFLVGPVMVGAGLLLNAWTGRSDLHLVFFFLAALWAYQHVIKQHFGFVALYRARAREFHRGELYFHKYYLLVSMWMPALMALLLSPGWAPSNPLLLWYADLVGLERTARHLELVQPVCTSVFWFAQAAFAGYLGWRVSAGRGINLQATLIAVLSVALHWIVVRTALTPIAEVSEMVRHTGNPPVALHTYYYAFVPLVTIYHNVQYHGLIWYYNRAKYRGADAARRYGLAARLNRNLPIYFACGLVYTLLTIGVEHYGIDFAAAVGATGALLFASAIWGWSFVHYWVDSKIWHVRQDAELRKVLGFE